MTTLLSSFFSFVIAVRFDYFFFLFHPLIATVREKRKGGSRQLFARVRAARMGVRVYSIQTVKIV